MVDPELWILETAATFQMPLWALVHPDMTSLHNKPSHGLDTSALWELLERLNWRGDIFIEDEDQRRRLYNARELGASAPRRWPKADRSYGLTAQGGARWEIEAQADWNRYVSNFSAPEEQEVREIVCADPDHLARYLSAEGLRTTPPEELKPWEATYWKVMPVGYRVRSKGEDGRSGLVMPGDLDSWYRKSYEERPR